MSVAQAYQAVLPLRESGLHLARLSVELRTRIHWKPVQMQSGTPGINTIRSLQTQSNQSQDHDPTRQLHPPMAPPNCTPRPAVTCMNVDEAALYTRIRSASAVVLGCITHSQIVEPSHRCSGACEKIGSAAGMLGFAELADAIQKKHGPTPLWPGSEWRSTSGAGRCWKHHNQQWAENLERPKP